MNLLKGIGLSGLVALSGIQRADACSVAFYTGEIAGGHGEQRMLTGRTMDLDDSFVELFPSTLMVYPRGLARDGNRKDGSLANPVRWTSNYGSIVMGESDGMNEKGLSVHLLYLHKTMYVQPGEAAASISCLKVLPYLLDNAATVADCIELIGQVMVVGENVEYMGGKEAPVHFAIRDSGNDAAIIEFINAGSVRRPRPIVSIHHGKEFDVMTNEPYYDRHLRNFRKYVNGRRAMPGDFNAVDRFVRLKMFKKTLRAGSDDWRTVCNVFSLMSTVHCMPVVIDYSRKESNEHSQWPTYWTTVVDLDNHTMYLKMSSSPNTIWLDMRNIDFKTLVKTGFLDPKDGGLVGEVSGSLVWQ